MALRHASPWQLHVWAGGLNRVDPFVGAVAYRAAALGLEGASHG